MSARKDEEPGIYAITRPAASAARPLVIDVPHSGRVYPPDFLPDCPDDLLKGAEDNEVDLLFDAAPVQGAALLVTQFPRTYIDVNRAITDIDAALLREPWE